MAIFFCQGFGVTKQVRLERIVRPHTRMPNQMTVSVAADTMGVRAFGQNVPAWTWLAEWSWCCRSSATMAEMAATAAGSLLPRLARSEEHTSELQSLMRISYAVFCLKKKQTELIIMLSIRDTA